MSAKFARSIAHLTIIMALCPIGLFAGSTVFTCKTDNGTVYQDHACATADATLDSKKVYAPRPCGSSCGVANGDAWAAAVAPQARRQEQQSQAAGIGACRKRCGPIRLPVYRQRQDMGAGKALSRQHDRVSTDQREWQRPVRQSHRRQRDAQG